jgi:hypothetical protein
MVSKWMGIYGRRWLFETMNSVIKRKFGDSIRERACPERSRRKVEEQEKNRILMAIAYNIHLVVRGGGENRFFLFVFLFLNKDACNKASLYNHVIFLRLVFFIFSSLLNKRVMNHLMLQFLSLIIAQYPIFDD